METRGFQFSAPTRQNLATVQGPRFDFASGTSLVPDVGDLPDPGIGMWLQGQQQATENLLSGVTVGIKGITDAVADRAKLDATTDQLKLKREQELRDADKKFLQDIFIANIKENSDSKNLKDTLTKLDIATKQRDLDAANFYDPLPEMVPSAPMGGVTPPDQNKSGFSAGTTGGFSAGLSDVKAPAPPQGSAGANKAPATRPIRFEERDIGGDKVALFDKMTGKIVPGTIADKGTSAEVPTPEGYNKESFTRKTPTGTETYKKQGNGKELTSEMVTKLSQFDSVKMSMDEIKTTMKGIDRGPITGFLREKNPYDVDAQYLNKLVESVVPGLARTVFGEVGVLTDADVKRYKEMVPNMKTEQQVAEALIKMLDKKITASYDGYIKTAKKAGYDVGGFEAASAEEKAATDTTAAQSGLYNEIKALREQVAKVSVVDTKRPELIQAIAQKTKEYINKTGQKPKF